MSDSLWPYGLYQFSSVQFSRSVMSDSLRPHDSQHARPPCPSPTPGVHSDSRPLSQWCHPAISSSVVPFSSCPQSLPASESFLMSQLFAWGGQSTGVSRRTKWDGGVPCRGIRNISTKCSIQTFVRCDEQISYKNNWGNASWLDTNAISWVFR